MVEEMLLQQNPSKFAILLNHLKFWGELWSGSEFSKCQNRGIRLIVILRDMTTKKKFPIRVVSARIVDLLKIK